MLALKLGNIYHYIKEITGYTYNQQGVKLAHVKFYLPIMSKNKYKPINADPEPIISSTIALKHLIIV